MMDKAFLARLYMFTSSLKQDKKDMCRSALIIQRSVQHHGTIIIMVRLLGCTVSTSTEMDPLEAFYSEVNDRHGLSTAWAPLHSFCLVQPCKSRNSVHKGKCFNATHVGGAAVEVERWDDRTHPSGDENGNEMK